MTDAGVARHLFPITGGEFRDALLSVPLADWPVSGIYGAGRVQVIVSNVVF